MSAFVGLEERVPPNHPLRSFEYFAHRALATPSPTFDAMCGAGGRPSIAPERLLKASLLISLYSVRSERAFCEELDYHLLWRWFLNMSLMERSFDQSTFSKNRGRLLQHVVAQHSSTRWFSRRMPWGCCRTSTSRRIGPRDGVKAGERVRTKTETATEGSADRRTARRFCTR